MARNRWKWFAEPDEPAWATERTDEYTPIAAHQLPGTATPPNLPHAPLLTPGQEQRSNDPRWPHARR